MAAMISDPNLTPAMSAPAGLKSNLIDPPSQGYITIIVMAVFLTLTTPAVLARIYTRRYINRCLWWDDYSCVIAWIGLFGLAGILFKSFEYGNGIDYWNVSVAQGAHFTKLFGTLEIVARISMFFTKLSILLLFQRIFVPPQPRKPGIFYAIWGVIMFNLLYCIALVLVVILQCAGKKEIPGQTCIHTYSLLVTASIINVLSDVAMLIIPWVAIWNLHMPMRRKLGVSVVFAVGVLAIASSVARLGWQIREANDPNRTIMLITVALMAVAEQMTGVIVSCMPVLPAFFRHVFHKPSNSTVASSSRSRISGRKTASSTFVHRSLQSKRTRRGLKDPYLLTTTDYEELDDLENGHRRQQDGQHGIVKLEGMGTTTTTIERGSCGDTLLPEHLVETLGQRPDTSALVSRSVQVELHPRAGVGEVDPAVPLEAHISR